MDEITTVDSFVYVDNGAHRSGPGACIMEWVSLIVGDHVRVLHDGRIQVNWVNTKVDHPTCVDSLVTNAAITINDSIAASRRGELARLIPQLLRARSIQDHDVAQRVHLRLFHWFVRSLLLDRTSWVSTDSYVGGLVDQALRQIELWITDGHESTNVDEVNLLRVDLLDAIIDSTPGTQHLLRQLEILLGDVSYDHVLYIELDFLIDLDEFDMDPITWLTELLLRYEKAIADEGLLLDPEPHYLDERELAELTERLAQGASG